MAFNLKFGTKQGYVEGLDSLLGPQKYQAEPVYSCEAEQDTEAIEKLIKMKEDKEEMKKKGEKPSFIPKDLDSSKLPKYSMEWEFNRGITFKDWDGVTVWHTAEIYWQLVEENPIYTCKEQAKLAKLSDAEVIALRLYTSPAYQPLQHFLRSFKSEDTKAEALKDENTWAQTIRHMTTGFEKLAKIEGARFSQVEDDVEYEEPPMVYRGMRGILPDEFFTPDDKGMVNYLEYGFSSTSHDLEVIEGFLDRNTFNFTLYIQ